ncbi:MAG: PKD domain-containing protein [Chitinophagaceae bacterium]|nr:PKD domain-containing protein [Chitinophagaceae bacterium]
MTRTKITIYILACCWLCSCKKDATPRPPDVLYSYTTSDDGFTITFTNQTDAASYQWDFGDGASSTDKNPVHTYPKKGKYVPTLYITTAGGVKAEGSTVIHIAKSSPIKLDDNSLSDWDAITQNVVTRGPKGGTFQKAKFDYNSDNVFFYIEMTSTPADIFDFYLDADNNPATGLLTGTFTGGAYDILLEGAMLHNWLDPFYFSGATQTSWGWSQQSIADFYQIGTVVQDGATLKFEGAFRRAKLKGLTGQGLRIAFTITKSDWSATLGSMPDQGSNAIFLDMSE